MGPSAQIHKLKATWWPMVTIRKGLPPTVDPSCAWIWVTEVFHGSGLRNMAHKLSLLIVFLAVCLAGCRTPLTHLIGGDSPASQCPLLSERPVAASATESKLTSTQADGARRVQLASWQPTPGTKTPVQESDDAHPTGPVATPAISDSNDAAAATNAEQLQLTDVISSVLTTFPLVQAAALQFEVAQGQVLSAEGAFDTKLKGSTENGPLGFYETYRHAVGAVQPLAYGGEVFGGYRVGRGVFQPWYQERQTNEGGEFKAGLSVPLSRNVDIDTRRAGVRKASLALSAADPQFRGEVIRTVQAGTEAYWQWVAAAAQRRIAEKVLGLATTRNEGLEEEVRTGAKAPPVLKDNRRSILSREAKLIDTQRKLNQSAAKLSIFLRTPTGEPRIPDEGQVPPFPKPGAPADVWQTRLIQQAIQSRPELRGLELEIERLAVEMAEAGNDLLPNVDAVIVGSQDMGEPTSKKRDKSEFELEAAVLVNVPLQRRKARGKLASLEAKRAQLSQKRSLTEDKIRTDIAVAFAAVKAAFERAERTSEARDLADFMAEVEREKFKAGQSDLLAVALREEMAAESASKAVDALLEYQLGRAALRAAVGIDDGSTIKWSP